MLKIGQTLTLELTLVTTAPSKVHLIRDKANLSPITGLVITALAVLVDITLI